MSEKLDESGIRSKLNDLPIIEAGEIGRFGEPEGFESNDHTPISLDQAAKGMLAVFGQNERADRTRQGEALEFVSYYGGGNETGVVAIRCGEDEFVLHKWAERD